MKLLLLGLAFWAAAAGCVAGCVVALSQHDDSGVRNFAQAAGAMVLAGAGVDVIRKVSAR